MAAPQSSANGRHNRATRADGDVTEHTFGVVGCGVIGSRMADAVAAHDALDLVAACDRDADRAASFAEEYAAEPYGDHRELLADGVDVVHVAVPPVAHAEVTTDALDAGTHVVCEKPLAPTARDAEPMVAAAEESDLTTTVNLPFRYTPGFVDLRERVGAGGIGEPRRVELRLRFPRWPREWQDVAWLAGRRQGGPLREVGTHFAFGVQELFGPVDRVAAETTYHGPDRYERSTVGHFAVGSVDGTVDLLTDVDAPEENSITVVGSEGSLSLTDWYRLVADRGTDDERVLVDEPGDTTAALLDELVADMEGTGGVGGSAAAEPGGDLVSFREALRVQRVIDALRASAGEPRELEYDR
jgi:predicted dehydrogenase